MHKASSRNFKTWDFDSHGLYGILYISYSNILQKFDENDSNSGFIIDSVFLLYTGIWYQPCFFLSDSDWTPQKQRCKELTAQSDQ